jgi:DNA-binding transcriptional ArsR family regulator
MEDQFAIETMIALAHKTRLALLRLLSDRGGSGISAKDAAARLGVDASTASKHLNALIVAGVARSRRTGPSVLYTADASGLRALTHHLGKLIPA